MKQLPEVRQDFDELKEAIENLIDDLLTANTENKVLEWAMKVDRLGSCKDIRDMIENLEGSLSNLEDSMEKIK